MPGAPLDLTIFVTSYNEAELIEATLTTVKESLAEFTFSYEVLIIDDASRDNSVQVIRDFIARHGLGERFKLIVNERNAGLGANYFRGAEMGRGKYFFVIHGDNAMRPEAIRAILGLLGKADIIIPYYNTKLFSERYNFDHRTFTRKLISLIYVNLVRLLSGQLLRYFNGLVLNQRDFVLKCRNDATGFGYQSELLCQILDDPKVTFLEVRVHNYDRASGGTTAFKLKNFASVGRSLARILYRRFAGYPPVQLK
jgi:glycosyltransferase involved in cell wall biosynthesis